MFYEAGTICNKYFLMSYIEQNFQSKLLKKESPEDQGNQKLVDPFPQVSLEGVNDWGNIIKVEQSMLVPENMKQAITPVQVKQKQRRRRYSRKGHWSLQENAKYYLFLKSHLIHFRSSQLRRLEKIFKQMSNNIGTRTANQCRSHHQKQEKKHQKLDVLMTNLYEATKLHPLLQEEPPFSKFDPRYKDLFEDVEEQPEPEIVEEQNNNQIVFIVYEMPVFLQPISYQQYMFLLSQKQLV